MKLTTKILKQIIKEEYSAIHSAGEPRTEKDNEYAAHMKTQQDAERDRRDRAAKATNDEPEFQTNPELEEGYGRPAYNALTGTYKTEREARKALAKARKDDPKFFENKPEGTYDVSAETIYKIIKAEDMADDFGASTITEAKEQQDGEVVEKFDTEVEAKAYIKGVGNTAMKIKQEDGKFHVIETE